MALTIDSCVTQFNRLLDAIQPGFSLPESVNEETFDVLVPAILDAFLFQPEYDGEDGKSGDMPILMGTATFKPNRQRPFSQFDRKAPVKPKSVAKPKGTAAMSQAEVSRRFDQIETIAKSVKATKPSPAPAKPKELTQQQVDALVAKNMNRPLTAEQESILKNIP
jgi:hypothetical protein